LLAKSTEKAVLLFGNAELVHIEPAAPLAAVKVTPVLVTV
jgi:hypothetical protein